MAVYWHHVGDQMSTRDFPRTIGKEGLGLVHFGVEDIDQFLEFTSPHQKFQWEEDKIAIGQSKFQIWGLPAGAKTALKKLRKRDTLLLLNSQADFGFFEYIGKVLARIEGEQWRLSTHLWGEAKFPIIVAVVGNLIKYPFTDFKSDFGYGTGLKGMGRVHAISTSALERSRFQTEGGLIDALGA